MNIRRLDHGYYTVPLWFGLLFTGLYVLFTPESSSVSDHLPNWVDNLLGLSMLAGAGLCLYGALSGTKWFNHDMPHRDSYKFEIVGLSIVCVVFGLLAWATNLTLVQQFTIVGGFGALLQIASINMIVQLWRAVQAAPVPQPNTN
jgi:hypothetical protein